MKKILAVMVSFCLFGGCAQTTQPVANPSSAQQETSSSSVSSAEASPEGGRELITGRVIGVEGSSVTIETVPYNGMQGGGRGGRPDSEPPKNTAENDAQPELESEEELQEPPAEEESSSISGSRGKRGKDRPDRENQPEARQTEEKTVSIQDGCSITIEKNHLETDGTLSDIAVGCIIRLTMSEDGKTVQSVSILGNMPERGLRDEVSPDDKNTVSSSSEVSSGAAAA